LSFIAHEKKAHTVLVFDMFHRNSIIRVMFFFTGENALNDVGADVQSAWKYKERTWH